MKKREIRPLPLEVTIMINNKIDTLKAEYKRIKIPPTVEQILQTSILKAKEENVNLNETIIVQDFEFIKKIKAYSFQKFKNTNLITRMAQIATASIVLIIVMANTSETFVRTMENVPYLGSLTNAVKFQKNSQTESSIELKDDALGGEMQRAASIREEGIEETTDILSQNDNEDMEQAVMAEPGEEKQEMMESDQEGTVGEAKIFQEVENDKLVDYEVCNSSLPFDDIFVENSDYKTILSDYITKELADLSMKKQGGDSLKVKNYEITGHEYFYFNADEDLVILIESEVAEADQMDANIEGKIEDEIGAEIEKEVDLEVEIEGEMIEVIIPREELKFILKNN